MARLWMHRESFVPCHEASTDGYYSLRTASESKSRTQSSEITMHDAAFCPHQNDRHVEADYQRWVVAGVRTSSL